MPRVSVHMPSYNHAPYVAAAIDSIERQTYRDFEIVVTDDASRDGTPDIIRALDNPRVKLNVFPTNRGAARAANDAIRRCSGEFIALISSDDVFLPQKLERQVAFLDNHPEIGAVFAYPSFIDHLGQPIAQDQALNGRLFDVENRSQVDWLRQFFFFGNCLCHPTILIRRVCYETVGLYDCRLAALPDFDMWVRLVQRYRIHVLPERLIAFRQVPNGGNVSSTRADNYMRFTWENPRVLRHYLDLSPELFDATFRPELQALGLDPNGERQSTLGRLCIATRNPTLHRLGLDLLYDSLPADVPDEAASLGSPHAEFHRHATGARDVYNVAAQSQVNHLEGKLREAIAALHRADQQMTDLAARRDAGRLAS